MPNIKVEPTIPNYPPQGIQAQLDLLYLWNPDVANNLLDQINKALEDLNKDLTSYLTKAEAAATYVTQEDLEAGLGEKQDLLTAEQLAAVNSGITAEHVTTYDAYAAEISQAQNDATKAENAAEVAQQTANLAGQEAAQALTQLAGKVNIAQGADNAGKVMTVGEDGNLAPADASGGTGIEYVTDLSYSNDFALAVDVIGPSIDFGVLNDGLYRIYMAARRKTINGLNESNPNPRLESFLEFEIKDGVPENAAIGLVGTNWFFYDNSPVWTQKVQSTAHEVGRVYKDQEDGHIKFVCRKFTNYKPAWYVFCADNWLEGENYTINDPAVIKLSKLYNLTTGETTTVTGQAYDYDAYPVPPNSSTEASITYVNTLFKMPSVYKYPTGGDTYMSDVDYIKIEFDASYSKGYTGLLNITLIKVIHADQFPVSNICVQFSGGKIVSAYVYDSADIMTWNTYTVGIDSEGTIYIGMDGVKYNDIVWSAYPNNGGLPYSSDDTTGTGGISVSSVKSVPASVVMKEVPRGGFVEATQTLPDVSMENYGDIKLYIGNDTDDYKNGAFYRATGDLSVVPSTLDHSGLVNNAGDPIADITVDINVDRLVEYIQAVSTSSGEFPDTDIVGTYTYYDDGLGGSIRLPSFDSLEGNDLDAIFTFTPNKPTSTVKFTTSNFVRGSKTLTNPHWEQVNAQPGLPDQTGNAGKFLTTDGTSARWDEVQPAAVTTDATLTGAGTPDSPLGVAQSIKDSIDEKLPLTGGTMSGDINIGNNSLNFAGDVAILGNGTIGGIYVKDGASIMMFNAQEHKIGNVAKLNNGADIAIPTTGGTMALLSDIPSGATVSSNVFTENLGNNIVRISGTESFGALAQQATTEHPITLPVTLADANYVVQTTATSATGVCEVVSGFAARTTTGFNITVRNLATAAEATDVAVCWSIIGQKV